MELRNLTQFPTDYLDAYCDAQHGHTNWVVLGNRTRFTIDDPKIASVVIFYKNPAEEENV